MVNLDKLKAKQIDKLIEVAKKAGGLIQTYYLEYKTDYVLKDDESEVTEADIDANKYIISELEKYFPGIAIVSEENSDEDNLQAASNDVYFMIDPLDGTRGFIKKSDEFTVNIALIKNGRPICGVIYLPAKKILYYTCAEFKAWKEKSGKREEITPVSTCKDVMTIICTKREPEKTDVISWLNDNNIRSDKLISIGSSYKFCLIADGSADLYPRKVSIRAWDIAAGEAIVKASGGRMCDYQGKDLVYKFIDDFVVPPFIVSGNFYI